MDSLRKIGFVLIATLALAVAACASDDELTQEEADKALLATMDATGQVDIYLDEMPRGAIDALVSCADGGSIQVQGTAEESGDFAFALEFAACVASDITIDGSLDYRASVTEDKVEMSLQGEASFRGAVEGDCALDVTVTATLAGVEVAGTACGHDVGGMLRFTDN